MAKAQTSSTPASETPVKKFQAPKGLTRITDDVVGFRDIETEGPIFGIPRAAKHSDNKQDKKKPSTFVIFELIELQGDPTVLTSDGEKVTPKPGDMVGVWTKGGMLSLRNTCGKKVWISYEGTKDIGKASPMKVYDIQAESGGTLIPVISDNRKESRDEPTFLDEKNPATSPAPF